MQQEYMPDGAVFNHYGPTEATVGVLMWPAQESDQQQEARGGVIASAPLGQPLGNIRGYVLDAQMEPVPPGVVGELYLGGANIARGYLGDAALTAERFVPDAYSGKAGERLYRTGDLVRWRAVGWLEYVGRIDEQMKVHGYRVEPQEIEAAIRGLEGVQDALVRLVRQQETGQQWLVAYVVGSPRSAEECRERLYGSLPEYMLPQRWVWLKEFPRTVHGKVDLQALSMAQEEAMVHEERQETSQAQTEIQHALIRLWE